MKRGIAIFLLGAFVYGTMLYPLHLWYKLHLQQEWPNFPAHNPEGKSEPLAQNEVVFKIPLAMPYHTDWEGPREASGLFENDGEFYTIVSKNYKQDTIYLTCYQNNNAREIFSLLAELVKPTSEDDSQQKNKPMTVLPDFFKKDFQVCSVFDFTRKPSSAAFLPKGGFIYSINYKLLFSSSFFRPPIFR